MWGRGAAWHWLWHVWHGQVSSPVASIRRPPGSPVSDLHRCSTSLLHAVVSELPTCALQGVEGKAAPHEQLRKHRLRADGQEHTNGSEAPLMKNLLKCV